MSVTSGGSDRPAAGSGENLILIRTHGVGRAHTLTEMTATAGGAHTIVMDEPPERGGTNQGMLPLQAMLASYAGCAHVIMNIIAQELGIEFSDVTLDAKGHLDPRGWMGIERVTPQFKRIELKISCSVSGAVGELNALQEQLTWRCPVGSTFRAAGIDVQEIWDVAGIDHAQDRHPAAVN